MIRPLPTVLLAGLLTAGCHVYQPAGEAPEPGQSVRVRLTAPGALEMSQVSDEAVRQYDGRLLESGPDTLILSVVRSRNVSEFQRSRTLRNEFPIPRTFVEQIEVRRLSAWRTTAVTAATVGLAGFLVYRAAGGGGSEGDPGDGNDGPQTIRIPLPFHIGHP